MYSIDFILSLTVEENHYMIDIGAQYGPGPIFSYLKDNEYSGLAIEGDSKAFNVLCKNLNNHKVSKHLGFVTPENVLNIFETYKVPTNPDVLKIDIDGYDLSVIRKILTQYKPKIILCEINEKIPPPIHFEVKYHPEYSWDTSHFFGFSVTAGVETLKPFDYVLCYIEGGNNAIFVCKDFFSLDFIKSLELLNTRDIYLRDYVNNDIFNDFPWNKDINHWQGIKNVQELKDDIFDYFTTKRKMRTEQLGKPISSNSFVLHIV